MRQGQFHSYSKMMFGNVPFLDKMELQKEHEEEAYSREEDEIIISCILENIDRSELRFHPNIYEKCRAQLHNKHSAASIKQRFISEILPNMVTHPGIQLDKIPIYYDKAGLDDVPPEIENILLSKMKEQSESVNVEQSTKLSENTIPKKGSTDMGTQTLKKPELSIKFKEDKLFININKKEHVFSTTEKNNNVRKVDPKFFDQVKLIEHHINTINENVLRIIKNPDQAKNLKTSFSLQDYKTLKPCKCFKSYDKKKSTIHVHTRDKKCSCKDENTRKSTT